MPHPLIARPAHRFTAYVPARARTRLTLAAGADSRGQLPRRTTEFLSDGPPLELPGGHLGTPERPEGFADRLAAALISISVGG